MKMDEPTYTYKLVGESQPLYVGVTYVRRFCLRMKEHAKTKPWWPEVKCIRARYFFSRREAEVEEAVLIRLDKPKYNVVTPWPRGGWRAVYGDDGLREPVATKPGARRWSEDETRALLRMRDEGKSFSTIAFGLGRTIDSVENKWGWWTTRQRQLTPKEATV